MLQRGHFLTRPALYERLLLLSVEAIVNYCLLNLYKVFVISLYCESLL
jgi:hypothetical protein